MVAEDFMAVAASTVEGADSAVVLEEASTAVEHFVVERDSAVVAAFAAVSGSPAEAFGAVSAVVLAGADEVGVVGDGVGA
jgi:hypothetical protein